MPKLAAPIVNKLDRVSVITNHVLYALDHEPLPVTANHCTVLHQAERAQSWLLHVYLREWLQHIGSVAADRSTELSQRLLQQLHEIAHLQRYVAPDGPLVDGTKTEQVFFLGSLQTKLRHFLASYIDSPTSRSLEWGIAARDVPQAVVDAFREASLDPVVSDGVSQCVMLAAFLSSQCLGNTSPLARRISESMLEARLLELLDALYNVPMAPEA